MFVLHKKRGKVTRISLNYAKRYVCAELLHFAINYKMSHELWRITNTYKAGLTPKEQEYLERCRTDLDDVWKRLTKMQNRLRHSANA